MTTLSFSAEQITITEHLHGWVPTEFMSAQCSRCHVMAIEVRGEPCFRSGVIVIDGEPVMERKFNGGNPRMFKTGERLPEQIRRLTEPCTTCGHIRDARPPKRWEYGDCFDCHGGKPTFTLRSERIENADYEPITHFVDLGDGWIITDVLPIITNAATPPDDGNFAEHFSEGSVIIYRDHDQVALIHITNAPGRFCVLIEQADRS